MTALSDLRSRVLAGSGEDQQLDVDIATTIGGFVLERRGRDTKAWLYPVSGVGVRRDPAPSALHGRLRYVSDLNAVIALVEERADQWTGIEIASRQRRTMWRAELSRLDDQGDEVAVSARASSPSRALLAALLEALEIADDNA